MVSDLKCEVCGAKHYARGRCKKHYYHLPEIKAKYKAYWSKPEVISKRKETRKKYYASKKYKLKLKEYWSREDVQLRHKKAKAKYRASLKGKKKVKEYSMSYYRKNRDRLVAKRRKELSTPEGREKNRQTVRKYYYKNKDKILAKHKIYDSRLDVKKRKNLLNKQPHRKAITRKNHKKYYHRVLKNDPLYKLQHNIRSGFNDALSLTKNKKSKSTFDMLGYTVEELKAHLEKQFDDKMSWENYGSYWHIDHKTPISFARTKEDVIRLYQLDNLQPLEAMTNIVKSNKVVGNLFGITF